LDAEDVVVGGEHVHGSRGTGTHLNGNLRVIDAREVTGTSGLMLFGLERERVRVHTGSGAATVVVVRLDLVEVLTLLLLEAVLAVEDKLEGVELTRRLFSEGGGGELGSVHGGAEVGDGHIAVGVEGIRGLVGLEGNLSDKVLRGEVPQGRLRGGVGEAPHKLLDGVVVGQTDLLGGGGINGIGTGVLHLLDQVFVTLLGEAATLLGVQVDVVGPDLQDRRVQEGGEIGREVDVDAHFMVLQSNEGQVQTGVPVEEEDQRQVHGTGTSTSVRRSGHLTPSGLLGFVQVKLRVQTPPFLVVLVNALTTDGQFHGRDRTLRDPVAVTSLRGGGGGDGRLEFEVHVTDEITVTGDGDGHATGVGGSTVDGLLDVLHREVSVALVFGLVEGNFGVTGKVDVLSAVSYELHKTTGHFESCCTISRENNSG